MRHLSVEQKFSFKNISQHKFLTGWLLLLLLNPSQKLLKVPSFFVVFLFRQQPKKEQQKPVKKFPQSCWFEIFAEINYLL